MRCLKTVFNGCVRANETYPGVREAQEEAVERMRTIQKPPRTWWTVVANLVPALVLLLV